MCCGKRDLQPIIGAMKASALKLGTSNLGVFVVAMVRPHVSALRERRATYPRSTPSIRDCHPAPVDLKYATTSGLYRTDTSNFLLSDFGRPRSARIGTMALNCLGDSGWASGSAFAADVIALSSSRLGITIFGRLDILDIVLHLTTIGSTQTYDSPHVTAVNEGHVAQRFRLRCERDHAQFGITESFVNPYQRSIPIKLARHSKTDAMLRLIGSVFGCLKLDSHALL